MPHFIKRYQLVVLVGLLSVLALVLVGRWLNATKRGGQGPAEPFRIAGNLYYGTNSRDIEFSPIVQWLLQEAITVADQLGHHRIRPEHLLLALLEGPACPAREALRGASCERRLLVESATRQARGDDSPLAYTAHLEVRVVPVSLDPNAEIRNAPSNEPLQPTSDVNSNVIRTTVTVARA